MTNIIIFKSTNVFDLNIKEYTLFYNLGFVQNLSNSDKYIGIKMYDLKTDNYINIYMVDINNTKPIIQLMPNQQSKNIIFNPPISTLKNIQLRFTNQFDKDYLFDDINFSFKMIISSIDNISNQITNELNISSDDIFTIIKSDL